ncbi:MULTISPECIES: DUF6895 family protein [Streptomycetaceae]|uniref:DUF6895 domain-containing protein n=1 Tax=Streptantibioticus cattleyicolor (strain ATCC 35852 / DSM 46488 / JCM 4925 / NBRC 14057 / NRRL 8057) TaxID=1003195 RepID=F8JNQ1_STREN|nr:MULTISPECIES: hypothetical protein [Streptomycetaceae]AEW92631.1 hypothetical protein SCATT_02600 [Streptantibioticus cattleyicolor NRRL 8057 = DSM 46488]MYS57409.1 hypothetical protein [Streptomyces sp. SID5468]CCB72986.1 conserved protein of unknown function [Streptantibioticus cattleyicolor NRRL 8057 = DSM 46488]
MIEPQVPRLAHQVATRALTWLHANRELGALPPDVTIDLADPDNAYKPLGETALAASLVLRENVAGPRQTQLAAELLEFCWQQLRGGDLLYERQLRHSLLTDPLETYAHFARAGYRHAPMEELLAGLTRLRAARAVECVPNRKLAVANARRVVGLEEDTDWDALTDATWLGATPEPWAVDWMTGYDVTHTVFHLTDWGARPEGLPQRLRGYVRTWLPVWVDVWQEVCQWDLMAELLIVDSACGEPVCGIGPWEQLARVQHEDGLTPRDADPVEEDPEIRYKDHQHPAVVAVIAGTVALSRSLDTGVRTG